jgi:hypothetical protein
MKAAKGKGVNGTGRECHPASIACLVLLVQVYPGGSLKIALALMLAPGLTQADGARMMTSSTCNSTT